MDERVVDTIENVVARILGWPMSPRIVDVSPGHGLTTFRGRGRPGLNEFIQDDVVGDVVFLLRQASGERKVEVLGWPDA
ncbi:hypothetical protein IV102_18150 [bacterium]|nr:hypothetical protein [bacterium]